MTEYDLFVSKLNLLESQLNSLKSQAEFIKKAIINNEKGMRLEKDLDRLREFLDIYAVALDVKKPNITFNESRNYFNVFFQLSSRHATQFEIGRTLLDDEVLLHEKIVDGTKKIEEYKEWVRQGEIKND